MVSSENNNAPSAAGVNPSSRSSSVPGEGHESPRPHRTNSGAGKTPSPPWTQIVTRGPESEGLDATLPPGTPSSETSALPELKDAQSKLGSSPENTEVESHPVNSDNASNKPVWNKPSDVASPETGLAICAGSWPTLSESTKASPKPQSSDPAVKNLPDASLSPPPPQRQVNTNPNPNSNHHLPNAAPNHARPARQRSMRRDGGLNPSSNGGFLHQPPQLNTGLVGDALHNNTSNNSSLKTSESSGRDQGHNSNNLNREGGQRGGGGDYTHQRSSFRRGNGRGDGSPHQSFGGRRDQDRGNHDWNHSKSFNGRDHAGPSQRGGGSRGYVRPQPPPAPFTTSPPGIRTPYPNPIGLLPVTDLPPLYYLAHSGMPFVAQMPPSYYAPAHDPQLHANILNQIDYYFSNQNLIKDTYLRQNMDENGWVSVHLIAGFKKVKQLTTDIQLILEAVRTSTVVETQDEKIRKRNDWMKWIMPPSVQFPVASGSQSPRIVGQNYSFQGLVLDDKAASSNSDFKVRVDSQPGNWSRSSSGGDQGGQQTQESSKDGRSTGC